MQQLVGRKGRKAGSVQQDRKWPSAGGSGVIAGCTSSLFGRRLRGQFHPQRSYRRLRRLCPQRIPRQPAHYDGAGAHGGHWSADGQRRNGAHGFLRSVLWCRRCCPPTERCPSGIPPATSPAGRVPTQDVPPGRLSGVALMDARSIAAPTANGGLLTAATEVVHTHRTGVPVRPLQLRCPGLPGLWQGQLRHPAQAGSQHQRLAEIAPWGRTCC